MINGPMSIGKIAQIKIRGDDVSILAAVECAPFVERAFNVIFEQRRMMTVALDFCAGFHQAFVDVHFEVLTRAADSLSIYASGGSGTRGGAAQAQSSDDGRGAGSVQARRLAGARPGEYALPGTGQRAGGDRTGA